jgi:hypothetical protein
MLPVPVVDPTSTTNTTVIGYGVFLLEVDGGGSSTNCYVKKTKGNDPFCAICTVP